MPYIDNGSKKAVAQNGAATAGELNYALTLVVKAYLAKKGMTYATINDVVGALDGCKMEFYRRVAAPYEDLKIIQNGDVY
jgi:hypothetical protein